MAVEFVTVDGTAATPYQLPSVVLTALETVLAPLASPTFTGTVTVPTPTAAGAAATKAYVDASSAGSGIYRDLGAGNAFPTVGPGGTPLQTNDAFDYAP